MKELFAKGVTLLDQERAAKSRGRKATADQKDAAKAKVADLSQPGRRGISGRVESPPEKDPNIHLFWRAWARPTIWQSK